MAAQMLKETHWAPGKVFDSQEVQRSKMGKTASSSCFDDDSQSDQKIFSVHWDPSANIKEKDDKVSG